MITKATFADSPTLQWDEAMSHALPALIEPTREVDQVAMPTAQILWSMKKYVDVRAGEVNQYVMDVNIDWGGSDFRYGTAGDMEFNVETKETGTRLQATPKVTYTATSIDDFSKSVWKEPKQMMNQMSRRQRRVNRGYTIGFNYEITAPTGYEATELVGVGGALNIDAVQDITQTEVFIQDLPAILSRMTSLPMILRPYVVGHNYLGFPVSNKMWRPKVFTAMNETDSEVRELNADNVAAGYFTAASWCVTSGDNIDLVFSPTGGGSYVTTITYNAVDIVLEELQVGGGYSILIQCPPRIYGSLRRQMFGQMRGTPDNPLRDIGLPVASFSYEEHNAILYSDPTFGKVWPNTMNFWDPECLYLALHHEWGPRIYPWVSIPGTTGNCFAKVNWGDVICTNLSACGALHAVQG